jgi:hypothetical protein
MGTKENTTTHVINTLSLRPSISLWVQERKKKTNEKNVDVITEVASKVTLVVLLSAACAVAQTDVDLDP